MTDIIKVLGQVAPAANTPTDLYTVPAVTMTTCSSLVVCDRGAGAGTFRVSVRVAGASASNEQYLYYDKAISSKETFSAVLGLTLNEGDVVTVEANSADLSFNLFGVETS